MLVLLRTSTRMLSYIGRLYLWMSWSLFTLFWVSIFPYIPLLLQYKVNVYFVFTIKVVNVTNGTVIFKLTVHIPLHWKTFHFFIKMSHIKVITHCSLETLLLLCVRGLCASLLFVCIHTYLLLQTFLITAKS